MLEIAKAEVEARRFSSADEAQQALIDEENTWCKIGLLHPS